MKVTFCSHDYANAVGGPFTWLVRMLPELKQRGVKPKVLFMTEDPSNAPHARTLESRGIETVVSTFPQSTEQRTRWFLQQVANDPPDIFVPNHVLPAYYAAGWIRDAGIPTVGILHSDDEYYRGIQSEFVFGSEFFRLSSIVCVSDFLRQEVQGKNPEQLVVKKIPYGVPTVEASARWDEASLGLVYVGRLVEEQKRISDLTRALCRAVKEVPDVLAVLYGDGADRGNVEAILAAEGFCAGDWLPGIVPSQEVQQRLLDAQIFVLLSDYEGLPIALMEAMACGLVPVCMAMQSGVPELIQDGVNGLIVRDRDENFVAAIRRLRDDKALWQRLSAAAKSTIRDELSIPVAADQWVSLFAQLSANGESPVPIKVPAKMSLPHKHPGVDALFSPDLSSRLARLKYKVNRLLKPCS